MKPIKQFYALIFIFIFAAISYLFVSTKEIQHTLNNNIENIFIHGAKGFADNIDRELHKHIQKNIYQELKKNKQLHHNIEHTLSIIVNDTFKYIFVLYRDQYGNYRYLLDGSTEKARFNQRLSVEKEKWDNVYETQQPLLINQNKLDNLWITYLKPFVLNGQTQAIIAIDFSTSLPTNVYHAIEPLNKIFIYIFISIGLLILTLAYQTLMSLRIKKESITDPLTQAYNRNYLRDFLNNIDISNYQVMMIDIDHFKKINDNYGHKAGDFILSGTAQLIKKEIREDDVFIRFGGEEFILFIKKPTKSSTLAMQIAQRIRKTIEKNQFNYEGTIIKITLSIGVTCHPEHFKNVSLAIKHADEMLYIAKREGRNQVISHIDTQTSTKTLDTQGKSINDVKSALEDHRILCFYQPIYNTKTMKIIKYEALVRLKEKDGSITPPNSFLDTIMYTNVYNDLTKTVLETVFEKISHAQVHISVNLNFSDILDTTIFKLIITELEAHKEHSSWLIIELLEYELLEDIELIQQRLLEIKKYGVKIAIDDFGSGYSNYAIFKLLPIDILKIDGSLIRDLDNSSISYTITNSIALLAQELHITTVAEFVHSAEVLNQVQQLKIDEAQGFYLAKPAEDILQ